MVDVPAAIPATTPVAGSMVATAVFTDVHAPPPVALLSVVVLPAQTVAVPVIVPVPGSVPTVTTVVAAAVPHMLMTV